MNHYKEHFEDREFCFNSEDEMKSFIKNGTKYTKPEDIKVQAVYELKETNI